MMTGISHFSCTSFFVAKPIDRLLCVDDKTAIGWMQKHLVTRVVAASLVVFGFIDTAFHLIVGMGSLLLCLLRCRITDGLSMFKHHLLQSIKFVMLCILAPLEVIFPDILTQSLINRAPKEHPFLKNDVSMLNSTRILKSYCPKSVEELQKILKEAEGNNWKISLGGQRHSQGGHQFYPSGVHVDMRGMDQILALDPKKKTIRVQAGVTWGKIQEYIHPHGLAVQSMQASNIFTIGGSLGTNVHGWDHKSGQLIETVREIRLLMPDGAIKRASQRENPELFSMAIGGYGLIGIILDAEIGLTDNVQYKKVAKELCLKEYSEFFEKNVLKDPEVGLHFARFSLDRNDLFGKLIAVSFKATQAAAPESLKEENHVEINQFLFHFYRRLPSFRHLRWPLEVQREKKNQEICRNNVMRPEIEFLNYYCSRDIDILQEYFVPKKHFESFTKDLAKIVSDCGINLLNVTVRFVKGNEISSLSYAKEDAFAFVLYINHETSKEAIDHVRKWTREVTDVALKHGGNFYLPYQQYQTDVQFKNAYPEFEIFIERKRFYDPEERLYSTFYETCCERIGKISKENCA